MQTGAQTKLRNKVEGGLGEGGVVVRLDMREGGGQVPEAPPRFRTVVQADLWEDGAEEGSRRWDGRRYTINWMPCRKLWQN